ncbi:MAG: DUF6326 family protein [Amnibacterium sp.]
MSAVNAPEQAGAIHRIEKDARRNGGGRLSLLWVFAVLNYLYCDLLGLMDATTLKQYLTGTVEGVRFTQGFLLAAGLLMEIPIAMVLLSSFLPRAASRWANIIAGALMTLVQIGSLVVGSGPTISYAFFSGVEIACTLFIVVYAWRWHPHRSAGDAPEASGPR